MNYFYHTKGALMAKKELKCPKFFQQLLNIHAQIEEKTDELNYWQSQYDPCSADQALSTEIQRRTEELQGLIRKMNAQKMFATRLIDRLKDPIGRIILRRRYIFCEPWSVIADLCGNMSIRNVYYIHTQSLEELENIYCGYEAVFI